MTRWWETPKIKWFSLTKTCSKCKEKQVLYIRKDNRLHRLIAHEYGIDRSTVGYIKSHKLWSHI